MAIIARVSGHGITNDLDLQVSVQFFDDNDPLNSGIGQGAAPGAVLLLESWSYPATLSGIQLQQALATDIRARGALFVRANSASADAKAMVPVGSLVALT